MNNVCPETSLRSRLTKKNRTYLHLFLTNVFKFNVKSFYVYQRSKNNTTFINHCYSCFTIFVFLWIRRRTVFYSPPCKAINNNSWTLYKNVPWSKVSSFKLRLKLKNEFLIYKKEVQVPFFVQVQHKKLLFSKIAKS